MSFFENAKRAFSSRYDEFEVDDRDYEDYEEEYEEEEPKRPLFSFLNRKADDEEEAYEEAPRSYERTNPAKEKYQSPFQKFTAPSPATPIRTNLAGTVIAVHYPESFNDASKIIREVKANKITVIDISTITSDEEARRIVDYIGGASEGMDCSFKRLCPSIFCFAPKGVEIELNKTRY